MTIIKNIYTRDVAFMVTDMTKIGTEYSVTGYWLNIHYQNVFLISEISTINFSVDDSKNWIYTEVEEYNEIKSAVFRPLRERSVS